MLWLLVLQLSVGKDPIPWDISAGMERCFHNKSTLASDVKALVVVVHCRMNLRPLYDVQQAGLFALDRGGSACLPPCRVLRPLPPAWVSSLWWRAGRSIPECFAWCCNITIITCGLNMCGFTSLVIVMIELNGLPSAGKNFSTRHLCVRVDDFYSKV